MGAGKGYCSEVFERRGIHSVDTDVVSRIVTQKGSPCLKELAEHFGEKILLPDGSLDRRALAAIAFTDSESTEALNFSTHKYILAECRRRLREREEKGDFAAIIDAPLLFESGFNNYCDYVIAVIAETETRVKRVIERDGLTREQAMARISKQHTNAFFRSRADFIIYNEENADPAMQIDIVIQQLKSL